MKKFLVLLLCVLFAWQLCAQKGISPTCDKAFSEVKNGNYEEAYMLFQQDIKNNPKAGYSYWGLAMCRYAMDDFEGTIAALDLAIKYLPKNEKCFVYRDKGVAYWDAGDTENALAALSAGIKSNPKEPSCYLKRADVYYNMEYFPLAQKDYEQVLALSSNNLRALYGMSQIVSQTNVHEARQWNNKAISLYRTEGGLYAWGALLAIGDGDLDEALDYVVSCVNYDFYSDYLGDAITILADTIPDKLLARFDAQQAKQPSNMIWANYANHICRYIQQPHRAIPYAEYVFQMSADSNTLFSLAETYSYAAEHDQALKIWQEKAPQWGVSPENYQSINLYFLNRTDRFEEILAGIDSLHTIISDDTAYYRNRTSIYMALEQWQNAMAELDKLEKIESRDDLIGVYNLRAAIYGILGDTTAMKAEYQKAIDINPDRVLAWFFNGDKERAMKQLAKNYNFETADDQDCYSIAQVYSMMGETELALKYLRKSFEQGYYFGMATSIMHDYELRNIRNLPEFKELMDEYAEKQKR